MRHNFEEDRVGRVDHVGPTGIYPASGPLPSGSPPVRGQGELAHPEERRAAYARSAARAGLSLGRILFGGYCLYNGIKYLMERRRLTENARSKQVPAAGIAVSASGLLLLLGGLSLLTGSMPRVGRGAALAAAALEPWLGPLYPGGGALVVWSPISRR
jgi:hypothetical protein